jgi:DNA-binding NarL/FixJ family response regulator
MNDIQRKTRIVIAEDHQVFRDGLLMALQRRSHIFEVVAEVDTGYKTLEVCKNEKPDILILDLHMPGDLDGFQVLQSIRREGMLIKVMVLTADPQGADIIVARLGADVCLAKSLSREEIMDNLEKLSESQVRFQTPHRQNNLHSTVPGGNTQLKPLSPKELAVLQAAARGQDTATIAQELVIAKGTVYVHLNSIYRKLGVNSLPQALSFAYRNNVLSTPR